VGWNGSAIDSPVPSDSAARTSPPTTATSRSPPGSGRVSRPATRRSAGASDAFARRIETWDSMPY